MWNERVNSTCGSTSDAKDCMVTGKKEKKKKWIMISNRKIDGLYLKNAFI